MNAAPLVNVLIITYNHVQFIEQCILSAVNQKTTFSYRIIVGDDFSNDGTRDILLKLKGQYPDKLELLLHPHRLIIEDKPTMYGKLNLMKTYEKCLGTKYIATLDGDDFWTDSNKLQEQVDFLESHEDYAICFHNAEYRYQDSNRPSFLGLNTDEPETTLINDLAIRSNYIPTCSVLYRNYFSEGLPIWFMDIKLGDWALHIYHAQFGKIKYIPKIMSVYRIHGEGTWTKSNEIERNTNTIESINILIDVFRDNKLLVENLNIGKELVINEKTILKTDNKKSLFKRIIQNALPYYLSIRCNF